MINNAKPPLTCPSRRYTYQDVWVDKVRQYKVLANYGTLARRLATTQLLLANFAPSRKVSFMINFSDLRSNALAEKKELELCFFEKIIQSYKRL